MKTKQERASLRANQQTKHQMDHRPPVTIIAPQPPPPPHFRELPFEELVDFLVGLALAKAIKGEPVREICHTICIKACAWHAHQLNEEKLRGMRKY